MKSIAAFILIMTNLNSYSQLKPIDYKDGEQTLSGFVSNPKKTLKKQTRNSNSSCMDGN